MTRRTIVSICGSIMFLPQMKLLEVEMARAGYDALLPDDSNVGATKDKRYFIDKHKSKIQISDAILVANFQKHNVTGYIGANTLIEIAFAYMLKKKIFILNICNLQSCCEEVEAMQTANLEGNIHKLYEYLCSRM